MKVLQPLVVLKKPYKISKKWKKFVDKRRCCLYNNIHVTSVACLFFTAYAVGKKVISDFSAMRFTWNQNTFCAEMIAVRRSTQEAEEAPLLRV